MIEKELCNLIIEKYYKDVFCFCFSQLHDKQEAEDCTQETFITFFEKRKKLYLTDNISSWLINTAVYIIKRHRRKNYYFEDISDYSEIIQDNSITGHDPIYIINKYLSADDAKLLLEYNSCERKDERSALARKYHLSLGNLATKITRIKQKLKSKIEENGQ